MTYQPFLIANMRVAKETDQDPWLLPDDAFPELFNAYQYRGVIRKKGGTQLFGRLGVRTQTLAVRAGAPQVYAGVLTTFPVSVGSLVITDGTTTFTGNNAGVMVVTAGVGTAGTINYTTGAYSVQFDALNNGATVTASYIRQVDDTSPVMGLCTRDINQISDNALVAFDMTTAYQYNNSLNVFQNISTYKGTTNPVVWSGANFQFFDYTNMQNAFFATNNVPGQMFYAITAITVAANAQVTTAVANNFAVGDVVYFNNVGGMVEINNLQGTVTVPGNPFTVSINSAAFTPYTSGGIAWSQTKTKATSGDGIRWYDGTGWVNFAPPLSGVTAPPGPEILQGALLLFSYKGRMVALNTWEGVAGVTATQYPQRARYSQNVSVSGSIYYAPPLPAGLTRPASANAWYTANGLGGALDAPTSEAIVGAEFIKDTLVVYFERSTYRLASPGNGVSPFKWEKINTEIGAESTFSTVPFDTEVLSVGSNGVYECDSINIERIDQKIPDEVFNFGNENQGIYRIQGIRDYYTQYVYWTYVNPGEESDGNTATGPTFPNRILAYNYLDAAWATFQNYFTCFGHYQSTGTLTWGNCAETWANMNVPWNFAPLQTKFPIILAGNQQGYVFTTNLVNDENSFPISNAASLDIVSNTNANPSVFTVPNHNLSLNSYVQVTGTGNATLDDKIFQVSPIDRNTFSLFDSSITGISVPAAIGGFITTVENFEIQSKKFTPFIESGQKVRVGYVDLFLGVEANNDPDDDDDEENVATNVTVYLYENENYTKPIVIKNVELTDPNGAEDDKFWNRVYLNQTAQSFSIAIRYSNPANNAPFQPYQIFNPDNAETAVGLNAMMFWMAPAGRLVR